MSVLRGVLGGLSAVIGFVLVMPLLALALPFWIVAWFTRVLATWREPRHTSWRELLTFDAAIGWKPRPHLNTHHIVTTQDGIFHTITDEEGWPGPRRLEDHDVVVFGDSFAFGYGVDSHRAFFAQARELRIKAIGAPGYNMTQEVLLMRQLAPRLSGKVVVWFIFIGNDLDENLNPYTFDYWRMPFVRETAPGVWEIVTDHISPERLPYTLDGYRDKYRWVRVHTDLHSDSFLSRRAYPACAYLIEQGRNICAAAGARLVILTIPDRFVLRQSGIEDMRSRCADLASFDPDLPDKKIRAACRALGVPFVAGKQSLRLGDYKELDPHWNEQGHRRVAELIEEIYVDAALDVAHAGVGGSLSP